MEMMNNMFDKFGVVYEPGDIIFCEYEPGENFYLIQEGSVRVTKLVDGKEKTLDIFSGGDMFGEMALLEDAPRTATAIAEKETKALQFNKENFDALLSTNQQIALRLLKVLARRIYEAKRRLGILLLENKEAKIMDTLLMLSETTSNPTDEDSDTPDTVEIKTSVQDIARWCAEDIRDAKKILSQYERLGKISIKGESIIIKNTNELMRIVGRYRKI